MRVGFRGFFVFDYYSPVLVFPVQLLFRRFWFLLCGFCLTFLFSTIILRFWVFLFSFCFVDVGFCCGDFVSSMHAVFGEKCCLFSVFWFWPLTFCSRDCCSNMHLVFDRGMMLVGGMFPNIFMHV